MAHQEDIIQVIRNVPYVVRHGDFMYLTSNSSTNQIVSMWTLRELQFTINMTDINYFMTMPLI